MTRVAPILLLVAGLALGCTTFSRSIGSSAVPQTGIHLVYAPDGRLLQKTKWRGGKLISAWQYEQQWELPLETLTAIQRGERDYPPSQWLQTVITGRGRIHTFDEKGHVIGFEDYFDGKFWRGAH